MGKQGESRGDTLDSFRPNLTNDELDQYFADPTATGKTLLAGATSRVIYDVNSFYRRGPSAGMRSSHVVREAHLHDPGGKAIRIQVSIQFMDGNGQSIQEKASAEPDPANPGNASHRWRCSGWVALNNKALPVQVFEPFYTSSAALELNAIAGNSTIEVYDALDRKVVTLFPNKSYNKVVWGAWKSESWDANDTVLSSPDKDPDIAPLIKSLPTSRYLPT